MSIFQQVIDGVFDDPNMGEDAIYVPDLGDQRTIRVMTKRPDAIIGLETARIQTNTATFDVRVSDVAAFTKKRDKIIFKGVTYVVQSAHYSDGDRLVWAVDTHPEACAT